MIMTVGEYIRKNDVNLAVAMVMLLHKDEMVKAENFEIDKGEVAYLVSKLKMPLDPNNPYPWAH